MGHRRAAALLHRGEENPLTLPCPCHAAKAPGGHPSMVRHQSRTCGREPFGGPLRLQERLQLLTVPAKTLVPHGLPHRSLLCRRDPPSYLHRMPSAPQGRGAWSESHCSESRAPTLLLLPPPADGHPPHQQDQGSTCLRETWLRPPEILGHCCSVTHVPPGQNNRSLWPKWQHHTGRLASCLQTHDLGIAEKLLPGVSRARHGCRRGRRDHGGTPVHPWGWPGPGLHLPPPFL